MLKSLPALLAALAVALFVVAIPPAIVTSNVLAWAFDASFYERGQIKFGATETAGLSSEQIAAASKALAGYFAAKGAILASELQKQGLSGGFFSERETKHLEDVKDILMRLDSVRQAALSYVALFTVAGFAFWRQRHIRRLGNGLMLGGALTLALIAIFGALSFADFSRLFLAFHLVSFSNDLWILDPRTDHLIRMFPPQFFYEASIALASNAALQGLGVTVVGLGLSTAARLRGL